MATKKKAKDDAVLLPKQIAVRLTEKEYERIEALAAHLSVSALARVALRVGLEAIERQPGILIGEAPKRR